MFVGEQIFARQEDFSLILIHKDVAPSYVRAIRSGADSRIGLNIPQQTSFIFTITSQIQILITYADYYYYYYYY
jgi:hypothetical protein